MPRPSFCTPGMNSAKIKRARRRYRLRTVVVIPAPNLKTDSEWNLERMTHDHMISFNQSSGYEKYFGSGKQQEQSEGRFYRVRSHDREGVDRHRGEDAN